MCKGTERLPATPIPLQEIMNQSSSTVQQETVTTKTMTTTTTTNENLNANTHNSFTIRKQERDKTRI
jgi:hypothetical protein